MLAIVEFVENNKRCVFRGLEMGITRETVSNQGERVVPGDSSKLIREHSLRYEFVLPFLKGGDSVIDCACGSGYGTQILARKASFVAGIDSSTAAITYCKQHYDNSNVEFKEQLAETIGYPSSHFDVFCSFETIEHLLSPWEFILEVWRVLKPGGLFIVSTPNRVASGLKPGEQPHNPFHVVEWSLKEFNEMLSARFNQVQYFGQRIRCHNKFHPMYMRSKFKRITNQQDITSIKQNTNLFDKLESPDSWQPDIFLAVCRRR